MFIIYCAEIPIIEIALSTEVSLLKCIFLYLGSRIVAAHKVELISTVLNLFSMFAISLHFVNEMSLGSLLEMHFKC